MEAFIQLANRITITINQRFYNNYFSRFVHNCGFFCIGKNKATFSSEIILTQPIYQIQYKPYSNGNMCPNSQINMTTNRFSIFLSKQYFISHLVFILSIFILNYQSMHRTTKFSTNKTLFIYHNWILCRLYISSQ